VRTLAAPRGFRTGMAQCAGLLRPTVLTGLLDRSRQERSNDSHHLFYCANCRLDAVPEGPNIYIGLSSPLIAVLNRKVIPGICDRGVGALRVRVEVPRIRTKWICATHMSRSSKREHLPDGTSQNPKNTHIIISKTRIMEMNIEFVRTIRKYTHVCPPTDRHSTAKSDEPASEHDLIQPTKLPVNPILSASSTIVASPGRAWSLIGISRVKKPLAFVAPSPATLRCRDIISKHK